MLLVLQRVLYVRFTCCSISKDGLKRLEPPALGRSIFSFAGGRKSVPSKWDEAERWLISSHCHQSPAQVTRSSDAIEVVITYDHLQQNVDTLAKKLTAGQLNAGTETNHGNSSSKSKCQTPKELSSPARHNTPSRTVKNYQISKHNFGTHFDPIVEDMSWCFKHSDVSCGRKIFAETGAFEDEERTKSHSRYRSEEAKIQAWVRLENVKAEAQSSKLEVLQLVNVCSVKIQRMIYDLEAKLMKKMAAANRRAEQQQQQQQQPSLIPLCGVGYMDLFTPLSSIPYAIDQVFFGLPLPLFYSIPYYIINRRAEEWRKLVQKQHCKNSLRSSNQEVKVKQQYDSELVKHSSCCCFSKASNS